MGCNLLGVISLRLPSIDIDVRSLPLPPLAIAYLAGATFALVASPCSTPVLASILVRAPPRPAAASDSTHVIDM